MTNVKQCARCCNPARKGQRYCSDCHNAWMRNWRAGRPLVGEARKKDIARSYAGVYLRRGKLERQACVVCGEPAQMHHEDYSKPLDVMWLCRAHHLALHAGGA